MRRAPAPSCFRIRGSVVQHPGGSRSAVLSTGALDLRGLDESRGAATLAAFERICTGLEWPLQLVIRVRRLHAFEDDATTDPQRATAMREFWSRRLIDRPAYARSVFAAVRAGPAEDLDERSDRLLEQLRTLGLPAARLDEPALQALLCDGLRSDLPVPWKEYPDHLEVGSLLYGSQVMRRLPGHRVAAGWLAPLLSVAAECDLALRLAPASLGHALRSLGRRLRDVSAHRLLEQERGALGDVHAEVAFDSAMSLRDRLARNLGRPLHLSLVACVRAADHEALRQGSRLVRQAFAATLMRVEPAHFRHLEAYLAAQPLALDPPAGAKLADSSAVATCFPWLDGGGLDPHGYRIGAAQPGGVPLRLDPFDTTSHANANLAVLAASGQGKSFALGALIVEAADRGVPSVIIDPEGEYSPLVAALGGRTLELAPGGEAALNVFECAGGRGDGAVTAVVELASVLCGAMLSEHARARVDAAARAALAQAGAEARTAVLSDCLPALRDTEPGVAAVIARFCSGGLGRLFNRPGNLVVDDRICNISLRELPDEHVAAATLLVAHALWGLVRRGSVRRHVVFDEVGALCVHAPLRSLLVQLARRCRKHGASLVVASQNTHDLLASPEGRVVLTNCETVLLGGHAAAETAEMERAFGLTPGQRRLLETAGRGHFLVLAGVRRVALSVEVPPLHRALIEGRGPLDAAAARPQDVGAPGRADPNMWEN